MPITLPLFFVDENSFERKLMRRLYHVGMRLLSRLLDILFPPSDTEALAREATYDVIAPLMRPTIHTLGKHSCISLLPYQHPVVRALVIEAKFKGSTHAQRLLGLILHNYLFEVRESVLLVPVPLGRVRLAERGYNQVEEVIRHGDRPVAHVLERVRETPPQTSVLGRSRRRNMEGAFAASAIDPEASYIVIDDVMTTGATLADTARALEEAGTVHIQLLAVAH